MHGDDRKFSGDCGLLAVTHWLHLPEVVNLLALLHSTPFALVFIFSLSIKTFELRELHHGRCHLSQFIAKAKLSAWSWIEVEVSWCLCLYLNAGQGGFTTQYSITHLLGIEPNEQALLLFRNMLDILDQFWRGHEQTGAVLWHIRFSQRAPINTKHHSKLKLCPTHFNQSAKKVNLDQLVF